MDNAIILNKYTSDEEVNMYINNDFNNDGILVIGNSIHRHNFA